MSADLEMMRAAAILESDPAAAAHRAGAILATQPGHEEASLLLATACRRLGDPVRAAGLLEALASAQPASATLQLELGKAYAAAGRTREATSALEAAVALDQELGEAWRELAAQRHLAGDELGGDRAYAKYLGLSPPASELADAAVAIVERRLDAAEALLQQQLRHTPDHVEALQMLATVKSTMGDFLETEKLLRRCLELAPGFAEARFALANELIAEQRHTEVLSLVERLLRLDPAQSAYLSLKAQALRLEGRNAEAIALLQTAIAAEPENARLRLLFGHLLREVGEQALTLEAYRSALAIQPGMGEAYWSLSNLKTVRFESADVADMERQLARTPPSDASRTHFEFALGKAYEDLERYAESFQHYARGNALQRSKIYYNGEEVSAAMQRHKPLYTAAFFAERKGWGSERQDPIFIVGLPRAGSTLLEQILASHSQVEGTRELLNVPAIVLELMQQASTTGEARYPGPVAMLERGQIESYAAQYLQQTAAFRHSDRPRYIDKLPGNFAHLGLLHLMFPRATIIDARRHPIACTFSCYKQYFSRGQPFAYDLGELGQHYRDYHGLMEHFDAVLPGRVHRLYYEQLVADPAGEVTRLLSQCELPFEAGCLRFYENRRAVTTISSEQVRRPISSEAVDQWRHFEPWLGRLKEALGDVIERYPSLPKIAS